MATLTFVGGIGDGYMYGTGASWATIRALAAANSTVDSAAAASSCSGYFDGAAYWLARALGMHDTAGIPGNATVGLVTLGLTRNANYGTGEQIDVVTTVNTAVAAAAYNIANYGATALGSFPALWALNTQNTQPLTGLTVNKTGITYLGLRGRNDMANTAPTGVNTGNWYSADATNAAYRPALTVEYTVPASGHVFPVIGSGIVNSRRIVRSL